MGRENFWDAWRMRMDHAFLYAIADMVVDAPTFAVENIATPMRIRGSIPGQWTSEYILCHGCYQFFSSTAYSIHTQSLIPSIGNKCKETQAFLQAGLDGYTLPWPDGIGQGAVPSTQEFWANVSALHPPIYWNTPQVYKPTILALAEITGGFYETVGKHLEFFCAAGVSLDPLITRHRPLAYAMLGPSWLLPGTTTELVPRGTFTTFQLILYNFRLNIPWIVKMQDYSKFWDTWAHVELTNQESLAIGNLSLKNRRDLARRITEQHGITEALREEIISYVTMINI